MTKKELIEAIRQFNRSVTPEFLEKFDVRDLQAYFDRVCSVMRGTPPPKNAPPRELIVA
jgi:hypothetical protein